MIEVKDIQTLIREYLESFGRFEVMYHRKWPLIAGENLRRYTSFARLEGTTICIYAKGSSARNLVMLEKKRLISDFNKAFPNALADDLKIIKR